MYLCGYSIDNLSLMALTISTGFVVDDAIVVLENITRYREQGLGHVEAAIKGAAEIGSTVVSMSVSLVAVFIPILLMGGIVGRLFREFAVVLSVTILVSLAVSLSTTPMMCAVLLARGEGPRQAVHGQRAGVRADSRGLRAQPGLGAGALHLGAHGGHRHRGIERVPLHRGAEGFFPAAGHGPAERQHRGRPGHFLPVDAEENPGTGRHREADPGVQNVLAFTGGGGGTTTNTGRVFISLKPLEERDATADQIITRLRPKLAAVPGATLFLQAVQDVRIGRAGNRTPSTSTRFKATTC